MLGSLPEEISLQNREFRRIYEEYAQKVYTFILWLTHNRSAADDILQEVFIKIWKVESIPAPPEERMCWLYRVARNACLDHFRKCSRFSRLRRAYGEENYDPNYHGETPFDWKIVDDLPETERSILYFHLRDGYTYKEIGVMLELTENNVRIKAFRALKGLREKLKKKAVWVTQ